MNNADLSLLTPTERAVWAELWRMEPHDVACRVERVLVDAIELRRAAPSLKSIERTPESRTA